MTEGFQSRRHIVVAIISTVALLSCDSPTAPKDLELSLDAPQTIQGTLRPADPMVGGEFLECILPVRVSAQGEPGDSANWLGGYWEYGRLNVSSSDASRTFTADDLASWWAFGAASIPAGGAQEYDVWFGYHPAGYWVRGYFTYDTGPGTPPKRIEYEFTCHSP